MARGGGPLLGEIGELGGLRRMLVDSEGERDFDVEWGLKGAEVAVGRGPPPTGRSTELNTGALAHAESSGA